MFDESCEPTVAGQESITDAVSVTERQALFRPPFWTPGKVLVLLIVAAFLIAGGALAIMQAIASISPQ